MNLTYSELEELVQKIGFILNKFEGNKEKNQSEYRYKLFLANGEAINFSVPTNTLAHILGVKTEYLIAAGIYNNKSSIEVLKSFCKDYYSIYTKVQNKVLSWDKIFSKHVKEKINNALSNLFISEYETDLVCKYESKKSIENGQNNQKFDYVIIKKFNDKIGVLCLVKNESYYVPMSNRIYNNLEEAEEFFNEILTNQTITILNGQQITNYYTDYLKTSNLNLNAKLDKITNLKFYKEKFNAVIDITGDYEYSINLLASRREQHHDNIGYIELIANSIRNGNIIKANELEENNLIQIANAFNDFLCSDSKGNSELSYSEVVNELKAIKEELLKLKKEKAEVDSDLKISNELNEELKRENTELIEQKNQIIKILSQKKEC